MKVYYFPLEPMETRYTADWWHMFDEVFTNNDIEFIKLAPPSPIVRTDGSNFLDWGHSMRYKAQQLQMFFQQRKNIKKDDWVFFADGEFPGIEMLEYYKKIEGKQFKIATIWHAGCYDDQTEVLTDSGFKLFKNVTKKDKIATLNPTTTELEYHYPSKLIKKRYIGHMYHFKNNVFNQMVTPNHNMYCEVYRRRSNKNLKNESGFKMYHAEDVKDSFIKIKRDCIWKGKEQKTFKLPLLNTTTWREKQYTKPFNMNDWLEFMGWYLSEGSSGCYGKNKIYSSSIRQTQQNYFNEIIDVCDRLGLSYIVHKGHSIVLNRKQLSRYLMQFGKSHDKYVPDYIKNLPPDQIHIFLTALFKGDGHFINDKELGLKKYTKQHQGKFRNYTTYSKRLADDVAELLIKCGYAVSINKTDKRYTLGVSHVCKETRNTQPAEKINYNGYVYCATVKNHIMLIKRDGKISWSGNSYDPNDLTYQKGLRKIGKHLEYAWFEICDKIFVASEFHKKLILRGAEYSNRKDLKNKIIVTGLPIYTDKLKSKIKKFEDKDIDILFGGRISEEKGYDKVRTMKEAGMNITVALDQNWSRDEWYDALSRAKILFAPSLQETFGYNTTEALAIGTMPVTSSAEVFQEYVPEGCMAEFHSTGNYTDLINHFMKHGYDPESLPRNIIKYDYKEVIGKMIEEMK